MFVYLLFDNYRLDQNPVCNSALTNTNLYCTLRQQTPYSTSLSKCGSATCLFQDQKVNPQNCSCAIPYQGQMIFRGPSFRDLTNSTLFHELEMSLWTSLSLTPGYVSISNLHFNSDDYLVLDLALFPSSGLFFSRSDISRIGFDLSNQTYKPPPMFGPYYFLASQYPFLGIR